MQTPIQDKSFLFAKRIVKLCHFLRAEHNELTLLNQLLRSGTSIGANVAEAQYAQSKADFINKLSIALKETNETNYWLRLLYETDYLTQKQFSSIFADCEELGRLLTSIIKSSKV